MLVTPLVSLTTSCIHINSAIGVTIAAMLSRVSPMAPLVLDVDQIHVAGQLDSAQTPAKLSFRAAGMMSASAGAKQQIFVYCFHLPDLFILVVGIFEHRELLTVILA